MPIACTLSPDRRGDQLARWRALLATARDNEAIPGGTRLRFERNADIAAIAALLAAEQDCCRFFTFSLHVNTDAVTLTVTAPDDARPILDALFGVGS